MDEDDAPKTIIILNATAKLQQIEGRPYYRVDVYPFTGCVEMTALCHWIWSLSDGSGCLCSEIVNDRGTAVKRLNNLARDKVQQMLSILE